MLKTATLSASLFLFVFTNLTFAQEEASEIMPAEPVVTETEVILADPEVVSEPDIVEPQPETTENPSVEPEQSPNEESLLTPEFEPLGAQISGSQDLVKKSVDTRFYSEPDPVTGSLVYKYPITIPPGRNMLQPDVNLLYSSQPDDEVSILGYGWNLDIPYIQRINKFGTNNLYFQNYFYSSVDGELRSTSSVNYSAKTDSGAFNRYVFSTSTSKWVMTDKFGTKYTFGSSSSTRQDNPSNSTQVFKWMLEEVRDTNNNYIKYEYTKSLGQIYPSRIVYTGNGVTDGNFEILFNKSTKSAIATSSATGFLVVANQQITGITVKIAGVNTMTYAIAYTPGDNGVRSLLERVTVSATSTEGVLSTLQPTKFSYKKSTDTKNWTEDPSKTIPIWFDSSTYLSDINGDGLIDILYSNQATASNTVYISNPTTWTYASSWVPPVYFSNNGSDLGARLVDVNGDGLVDVVQSFTGATSSVYLNNGSNWTASTSWSVPVKIASSTVDDLGVRFIDVNGDSLTDIVRSSAGSSTVYVNSGLGWQASTTWTVPVDFVTSTGADNYVRLEDANGDGLPDLLQSYSTNGSVTQNRIYINSGSGWSLDTRRTIPVSFGDVQTTESGVRLADVNGDGLVDIVQSYLNVQTYVATYINSGSGWVIDELWNAPEAFINGTTDYAIRLADVNGDGLMDMMRSYGPTEPVKKVYANNNRPVDILTTVTYPEGGKSRFEYKAAQEYKQGNTLLNNRLPYAVNTLSVVSLDNGQNIIGSTTYQYIDGLYHFTNALDRQFAGFKSIVKTEPSGSVTKTFYHQGDTSSTTQGEYQDVAAKIGQAYRTELYDKNSNLNSKSIYKWDHSVTGSSTFVKLIQQTVFTYEGDSSHRDKAESFTFNDTNGNISTVKNWGEVTANDDGSFTDIGQDLSISTTTYAASSSAYVVALPASMVTSDQSGQKTSEQKMYYDNQSLNGVLSGNLTKKEQWINSTTTASSTSVYNLYGLPTSQKDARGNTTSYSYEPFNLYVSTTTDALNYKTFSTYNYLTGKPATSTDQNGVTVATTYDGFGRPLKIKIPDINSSSTPLITKTQFQYFDTTQPSAKVTSYLNSATNTESYIYSDGLGRTIQKRVEAEQSGDFVVNNYKYNAQGLLSAESLPYFDNGSNLSSHSINKKLYTYYDYDSLGRLVAVGTAVGTTSTTNIDWGSVITDSNGKVRGYLYDVFGNLIQVTENNGTSTYVTTYAYNSNNNLIKITDALGNIRNFYYDAIGRQIKAEDLHATSDTTFGEWNYIYDLSGNKVTIVDPKLQVINYTYDVLNRVLTENYTGTAGTEKTYTYDSCTKGIGRICSAGTPSATTTYIYNHLGEVQSETKTISGTTYQTQFAYNWLGDTTQITYPDSSQVTYLYNSAGLLETVLYKEVGTTSSKVIVSDFNYAPTGQVSYQKNGNQTETFNTFDKDNLYRLIEKKTIGPGLGIEEIQGLGLMMMGEEENQNEYLNATNDNPVELKALNTTNSKTFLLGRNKKGDQIYSARVYTKPVYEVGAAGEFVNESESKIEQDNKGWNITNQKFTSHISKSSTDLYSLTTANGFVIVSIADSKHNQGVLVLQKDAQQGESVFEIKEVLGKSSDIEIQVGDTQIKKDVVLREKPTFVDLSSDYKVTFKILATSTLDAISGTKKLSEEKIITSSDEIVLISSLGTVGYIFPPIAQDSSEATNPFKVIPIELTYELKSDGIYVTKTIPREWLESAVYPVRADFVISAQSGVGDGHVLSQPWLSNWSTQQSSSVGRLPNYTGLDFTVESIARTSNELIIRRGFVPVDTSFLPDNAVISSSTLYVYVKSKSDQFNDSYATINVYQGLQTSPTSIISSDYSKCGNVITNPTKGSTDIDITNITASSFIGLTLNASGRSWASTTGFTKLCIREGHDAANQAPSTSGTWQSSGVVIAASESVGTTTDPYLEIVYTVPNTTPGTPTSLLTESATNPVGVTTLTPRFSAKFNDTDQYDSAISYQIQVSANSQFTDLRWDSGKTTLPSSVAVDSFTSDIQYAGDELDRDSATYYWRIKLWDASDSASAWSVSTSTFTMSNDGKLLQKLNYSYDSFGNITKIIDSANGSKLLTTAYVYDDLYRLISATATSSAGTPTSTSVYKTALSIYSTSTLSDFPVYVNLANLPSSFWSNVKGDGGDVRVTDKLGNLLPIDLVSFSTSTQTGELYFKPSSIVGGTTTVFFIIHGISSWQLLTDDDVLGSFAVWSGHRGRWQQVGATQSTSKRSNSVGSNGTLAEVNTPTATNDSAGRSNGSY